MQNILVTGGAGYIGSHTCKALSSSGLRPITFDSLVTGNRWAVKWGPFEEGDISDKERLVEVIHKYAPVAAIHFAACAYVGESVTDPAKYYSNNVAGTITLLDALRETGLKRIVFSSSCATYGIPDQVPIQEGAPQSPVNPYGRSKLMIEQILTDYAKAFDFSCVALRYFNAAGADPENEIGEHHDPETHLIPLILETAIDATKPLTVFGDDYDTSDGTCIRDYTHVSDLAAAHVLALQNTPGGGGFAAFNLGTGNGFSIKQIIEEANRVTGLTIPYTVGPRRPGDPAELVADPAKAREELGWKPQHSDIGSVIQTSWNWMNR
jgi:UDP-arabinose 4-epimerase